MSSALIPLLSFVLTAFPASQEGSAVRAPSDGGTADGEALARGIERFESHFDAANRLSGVLLVARGEQVILHRAYGLAAEGVPNRLDTRIPIASITKIMTSLVLTQLLAEAKLEVDAPIARWLPDFPRADAITVGHLARHRAGIRHRVTTPEEELRPLSTQDIVERAARSPLLFEPGSESSYSSAGYTVLVRCMELASGQPYARLLRERIFDPAGMQDSFEPLPGGPRTGLAQSFVPGRGELLPAAPKDLCFLAGAGSVVSTAGDMWRFLQAFRAGKLVAPFSAYAPDGRVAWTGASNGCFAFVDAHPEDDLVCIWLGNSWGGCAGALRGALPALARGEETVPPARPPLVDTPSPGALAAYVGSYESRPGATYDVEVRGSELWMADSMLLAIGVDRFWQQPWHAEVAFVREGDAVVALERRDAQPPPRWPRVAGGSK